MIPNVDQMLRIDTREAVIDIARQSVVTREGTNMWVDGVVYYKVFDANRALLAITQVKRAIELVAATKLREILALYTYNQIQMERVKLAQALKAILDNASEPWGVDITRVELSELSLPDSLQMAMNSEQEEKRKAVAAKVAANSRAEVAFVDAHGAKNAQLVAAKAQAEAMLVNANAKAKAQKIEAEGELKASESFKEAADIYASEPVTLQLRYLQTLKNMGKGKSQTIIIPYNKDSGSVGTLTTGMAVAGK